MLEIELIQLVHKIREEKCEKQNIEMKRASGGAPSRLYDTLSSFSNQIGGGIIIFGIDEEANFEITGVYNAQDLQKKVGEQALQMVPVVRPLFTVVQIDGKLVVSVEIAECDIFEKPCFYKGAGRVRGSYIRVGDSDQRMKEYEIYSYEAYRKQIHDELRSVERAGMHHFQGDLLTEYLIKLRREKPNLVHMEDARILETQGIIQNGQPTLTGILLLGEYPQEFFPQLGITAMVVAGKDVGDLGDEGERFIDNKRIEGTIPQMLEEAIVFVRRNMKMKTIITEEGKRADKPEYPLKAVREILLNALVHRDYSMHTDRSPIRLQMYQDRLEVDNPGGLYGRITIDELGKVAADTRNPYIAGALEIMIDTENRYSGIPTIRRECKLAKLADPIFLNQKGTFSVTLYNRHIDREKPLQMEEEILAYCKTPRSREELAKKFGFDTPSYFVKRYIKPLIEQERIRMTIPEKPKSKNQKYHS
jgi:ATP-dependent DNA helicase RecG